MSDSLAITPSPSSVLPFLTTSVSSTDAISVADLPGGGGGGGGEPSMVPPVLPSLLAEVTAAVIPGLNSAVDAPLIVAKGYQLGVIIILSIGLYFCIRTLVAMYHNFSRLAPIIKYHSVIIVHDLSMCLNFISRDIYHLWYDLPLQTGPWCQWSAMWAMVSVTSLYISAAAIAFATYSLTERRPLSGQTMVAIHVTSIATAAAMTMIVSGQTLGPYKGLYCAMEMNGHYVYTTIPFIVVFIASLGFMGFWYAKSYRPFRDAARTGYDVVAEASELLLSEGITLMLLSQASWGFLLLNGVIASFGIHVHYSVDIAAAWVAKLQPSIDSIVLMHMMQHGVIFIKQAEEAHNQGGDGGQDQQDPPPSSAFRDSDSRGGPPGSGKGLDTPPPSFLLVDMMKFGDLLTSKSRALSKTALITRFLEGLYRTSLLGSHAGDPPAKAGLRMMEMQPPPDLTGMSDMVEVSVK